MNKDARTFGQDLMRGEHTVGEGKAKKRRPNAIPGGGGYGANSAYLFKTPNGYRSPKDMGLSINTTEWVREKIEAGDIDGGMAQMHTGTSIFDPVLCELVYRWFSPPAGLVLDPFAGGSVRGIVANKLGRRYCGVDLSARQIEANEEQARAICAEPKPEWINGDSRDVLASCDKTADLIFSCPPYADLEVYSEDPRDLSVMEHQEFLAAYRTIIELGCARLAADRFACFVIGDVRDRQGFYRNLPGATVAAFEAAGLRLYNDCILVTAVGSLPIRVRRQFEVSRKLGKTHQNVLVFVKGDPRAAAEAIGLVEFGDVLDAPADGVEEL
jgi:hypothetical protein